MDMHLIPLSIAGCSLPHRAILDILDKVACPVGSDEKVHFRPVLLHLRPGFHTKLAIHHPSQLLLCSGESSAYPYFLF